MPTPHDSPTRPLASSSALSLETVMPMYIAIDAPLGDTAVHIIKAPVIWFLRRDGVKAAGGVIAVPPHLIEPTIPGKRRHRSGPTGEFPFRLGRKPVRAAFCQAEASAEFHRVHPRNSVDRRVVIALRNTPRQRAHHVLVLSPRDLRGRDVERFLDVKDVSTLIVCATYLIFGAPHSERTRRNLDQLHPDSVAKTRQYLRCTRADARPLIRPQRPRGGHGDHEKTS